MREKLLSWRKNETSTIQLKDSSSKKHKNLEKIKELLSGLSPKKDLNISNIERP